jgi:hypothetical protein
MHPEDQIHKTKTFINELQNVQDKYFEDLSENLNLSSIGKDWLFDYIFNTKDEKYDDFEHYLIDFKKTYGEMLRDNGCVPSPSVNLMSTNFGEFNPWVHMSSYEADLETSFPSPFNEGEPISLGIKDSEFEKLTIQNNKVTVKSND